MYLATMTIPEMRNQLATESDERLSQLSKEAVSKTLRILATAELSTRKGKD